MGWGDRLIGALSLQVERMSYLGWNPNTRMAPRYRQIVNDLRHELTAYRKGTSIGTSTYRGYGKKLIFYTQAFEDPTWF